MPRRWRTAIALLLSLLLVAMQAEAHRHALSHYAPPAAAQHAIWQVPADTSCAECGLLAAGAAALIDQGAQHSAPPIADLRSDAAFVAPTPALPSSYRSRAPPPCS